MRDAVRGHRSLLVDGLVLHRDVSVNNVLITLPTDERPDGFKGCLLDLDHAITSDPLGHHSGAPERTGTFEFMSTRARRSAPEFRHCYYDDLQSFMWVFFWLITCDRERWLAEWSNPNPLAAALYKMDQIQSKEAFEQQLAPHFAPHLGTAVGHAAANLRNVLWPDPLSKDLDSEKVRDDLYKAVIGAFKNALEGARKEAVTLEPRVVVSRDRMAY